MSYGGQVQKQTKHMPFCTRYMYRFIKLSRLPKKAALLSLLFRQLDVAKAYGSGWVPKKWHERSGIVSRWFKTRVLRIHRGKGWRRLKVLRWTVGFSWGEFARTTSLAVFKKKATAKKQKKKTLSAKADLRMSLRVQQIKDVKAGIRRKSVIRYDDPVSLAIQAATA